MDELARTCISQCALADAEGLCFEREEPSRCSVRPFPLHQRGGKRVENRDLLKVREKGHFLRSPITVSVGAFKDREESLKNLSIGTCQQ